MTMRSEGEAALAREASAVRLTANQRRAAQHVLDQRGAYSTLDELAEAIAFAVLAAEDPNSRHVVVTRTSGTLYAFGPYATREAALKAVEKAGLATHPDTVGTVLPLIPAPRSPLTAEQIKPPKKAAPKKRVAA